MEEMLARVDDWLTYDQSSRTRMPTKGVTTMTVYEPNPAVRETGEEAGEFVEEPDRPLPPQPHHDEEASSADRDARRDAADADDPEARLYTSTPLEDEDGNTYVIQ